MKNSSGGRISLNIIESSIIDSWAMVDVGKDVLNKLRSKQKEKGGWMVHVFSEASGMEKTY